MKERDENMSSLTSVVDRAVVITDIGSDFDLESVDESFTEMAVKIYFNDKGFYVCTHCEKNPPESCNECAYSDGEYKGGQHGIDIVARKGAITWIVEVKGVRPSRGASFNQAFLEAVAQTILNMKIIGSTIYYAIALPAARRYLTLLNKLLASSAFKVLDLHVLLLRQRDDTLLVERLDVPRGQPAENRKNPTECCTHRMDAFI